MWESSVRLDYMYTGVSYFGLPGLFMYVMARLFPIALCTALVVTFSYVIRCSAVYMPGDVVPRNG